MHEGTGGLRKSTSHADMRSPYRALSQQNPCAPEARVKGILGLCENTGHAQVARQRQLSATSKRVPVDHRNRRHGQSLLHHTEIILALQ